MSRSLIAGTVPVVTTQKLAEDLGQKAKVVLLDARERKEYETSHLPGAIWVGFDDFEIARVAKISRGARIVVYCSVGYRSEKVGEKLKEAGFGKVENLFSGLFAWANEGKPLVNQEGKATKKVHAYDANWARFLSPVVMKVLE